MTVKRPPENPLALAVLALLYERPMHPYEMAATLKERRKEQSIKLRYGSLYTVIAALQASGMILARERRREGRRPERTVFEITSAGIERLGGWMTELLARPVKEYPRFEAALSLIAMLPPDRVAVLLDERAGHLALQIDGMRAEREQGLAAGVLELFLVECDFALAMTETERRFVAELAARIRNGEIGGLAFWRDFHAAGRPVQPGRSREREQE